MLLTWANMWHTCTGWNTSAKLKPLPGNTSYFVYPSLVDVFVCLCVVLWFFSARWRRDLWPNIRDSGNQWGVCVCACTCVCVRMCVFLYVGSSPLSELPEVEPQFRGRVHTQNTLTVGVRGQWLGLSCFSVSPTGQKGTGQNSSTLFSNKLCIYLLPSTDESPQGREQHREGEEKEEEERRWNEGKQGRVSAGFKILK